MTDPEMRNEIRKGKFGNKWLHTLWESTHECSGLQEDILEDEKLAQFVNSSQGLEQDIRVIELTGNIENNYIKLGGMGEKNLKGEGKISSESLRGN